MQSLRFASRTPPLALTRGTLAMGSVCRPCGESVVSFSFSPAPPCASEPFVRIELREGMPEYVEGLGSLTVVGVDASGADFRRTDSEAGGGGTFAEGDVAVDVDIVFDPDVEVLGPGGELGPRRMQGRPAPGKVCSRPHSR